MAELNRLFESWAASQIATDPSYFARLAEGQAPKYLWIGCSDSRVPANQILDLAPGEVFVHRNVANRVVHTNMSCLSVIQFAVEVLKIEHIIVCGHYSCGGVHAACGSQQFGLIDNWLRNIKDVYRAYKTELDAIADPHARAERLCELNVIEQVKNVCHTTIVQNAWASGRPLSIHGVIYGPKDGLLRDLAVRINTLRLSRSRQLHGGRRQLASWRYPMRRDKQSSQHLVTLIERFKTVRRKIDRERHNPNSSPVRLLRLQRLATIRHRLASVISDNIRRRKNGCFAGLFVASTS